MKHRDESGNGSKGWWELERGDMVRLRTGPNPEDSTDIRVSREADGRIEIRTNGGGVIVLSRSSNVIEIGSTDNLVGLD